MTHSSSLGAFASTIPPLLCTVSLEYIHSHISHFSQSLSLSTKLSRKYPIARFPWKEPKNAWAPPSSKDCSPSQIQQLYLTNNQPRRSIHKSVRVYQLNIAIIPPNICTKKTRRRKPQSYIHPMAPHACSAATLNAILDMRLLLTSYGLIPFCFAGCG